MHYACIHMHNIAHLFSAADGLKALRNCHQGDDPAHKREILDVNSTAASEEGQLLHVRHVAHISGVPLYLLFLHFSTLKWSFWERLQHRLL